MSFQISTRPGRYGATAAPVRTLSRRLFSALSFVALFLLLSSTCLSGQTYETTGLSSDWDDPGAWSCSGDGCVAAPNPGYKIQNSNVIIRHDIHYSSNIPVRVLKKGSVTILDGAKFTLDSKITIYKTGSLAISNGALEAEYGVINEKGDVILENALLQANANVLNKGDLTLSNSCIDLFDGNFINTTSLDGQGSVRTRDGNVINAGAWSPDVSYCASGITYNVPVAEDCGATDGLCNCLITNCDILPGYSPTIKVNNPTGSELTSLGQTYDPNGDPPSESIYRINNNEEVLIEIVVLEGKYNDVLNFLAGYGIGPNDFYDDRINTVSDELLITVFFPISGLANLAQQTNIINFARPVSPGLNNAGLISSQGDQAQGSPLGRLGWKLSGQGIRVGVISDSYASNAQARDNDITNGDLPGQENPVVVARDYPFGLASDEGRAMLQIVHDVAPEA
ncbi:MAG: hypothetical protein KDD06_16550, partial [Phaeodactylibacter sp.]|nr:hypothetical protein [Phaeodactylibacter sp.]